MSTLGKSVKRIDAAGKLTGETLYSGDINMPNQLYGKILFANRPHAIIKNINIDAAKSIDGVVDIFTARDVPLNEYGLIMTDQPVLCGPGSEKPYCDRVRHVGDQIAFVVATSEEIASKARDLIVVDFEDLPIVSSTEQALALGATLIHPEKESNSILSYKIRKGDVDAAFALADVIVESEYRTPAQEHAYLAPESGIAYIDGEEKITIAVPGQWAHEEQAMIAHSLGLKKEQIRIIHPAIGGAFGGREDLSIQLVMGLAVMKLNERGIRQPVKVIWSREESIIGHHKRHPYLIRSKWGATKDGRIIAAKSEVIADGGAYAYTSTKVLGNATMSVTGPYKIENVWVDSQVVYTNNLPSGAFRGFGGPQGTFASEMQINKLAEKLNIDAVELRLINVARDGDLISTNTPLPKGVTLDQVIERCAIESEWENTDGNWQRPVLESGDKDYLRRGRGFSSAFKNIGFSFGFPERCWATIELHGDTEIEEVILYHAGSDVGQGAHTVFQQMAAHAVGVSIDKVTLKMADTKNTGDAGSTSASRMTFMAGNAIRGAGEKALAMWKDEARPVVAEYNFTPPKTTPYHPETGESIPNFAYGYIANTIDLEVDIETGQIKILDVVCVDDVGNAINPQQIIGQIEGCIVQAAGYTILENFIQEEGMVKTSQFSTYLIPTILDIPKNIKSVLVESNDLVGPWGAKGMAEMPFLPFTPAVMDALHQATGVWFDKFPLTPERVLAGIEEAAASN
jgi:CO/xanthine dehydrogenase Mo-binding subunit